MLLNLYRYSSEAREELEKALKGAEDKIFITHQAAKEFLKNRLGVTAGQAKEYEGPIQSIKTLSTALLNKNKHPFLPETDLSKFKQYSEELIAVLEKQQQLLFAKLSDDEILDFVEKLFDGKTGSQFSEEELLKITNEGEERYKLEIPPGYKDSKKDSVDDKYRKYGDLIVWKQIIALSKSNDKPVIFITDDKKEDWWLEQSGRTITPRPEIIEEFHKETRQKFWMYTVDKFITESAKLSELTVSPKIIEEIIKISSDTNESDEYDQPSPSIEVHQEHFESPVGEQQSGYLVVHLNRPMRYATGTGKFLPRFSSVPEFNIKLIDSPCENKDMIRLSFGCGTTRDFNVHLKSKDGHLDAGDYVFEYTAYIDELTEK